MAVALLFTGYYRDPKLAAATHEVGPLAEVLWVRALDHCAEKNTGGFMAPGIADQILGRRASKYANALVRHGAWYESTVVSGAYEVHDYHEWNKSTAELEEQRRAKSESKRRAGRAGAAARWGSRLPVAPEAAGG